MNYKYPLYIVNVYMTILWCVMKSLQGCVEAHLQYSNGTLCFIALEDLRRGRKPSKTLFMWAQLKTVMLVREAIKLAFLWATSLKKNINIYH